MRILISGIFFFSAVIATLALVAEEGVEGPELPTGPSPTEVAPEPTPTPPPPTGVPKRIPETAPPTISTTPPRAAAGGDKMDLTFENMQLATMIKLVAERTGRNFLIQMPISGTFTIYAKDIPGDQVLDVLGLILDSLGYTMVVSDEPPLIYVAKKAGASAIASEIVTEGEGEGPDDEHKLSTLVVVLKYVTVDDMQNILRNFKSPTCVMTAYPAGNFLILKDEEASLKYLLTMVKKIDIPGTLSKVTMVELKYADASETASLLTELMAAKEGARVTTGAAPRTPPTPGRGPTPIPTTLSPTIVGAAAPLKIIPEVRTNRIVILASEKDTEYMLDLVERLDVEPTEDMYPIRTYIAQYQNAADLADTLLSFVANQPRRITGRESRVRTSRTRTTAGPTPAAAPTPTAAARAPVTGATEEAFFLADPATNMVLIQASPQKLDMYMELLGKLDQPQKQVLIEVWVVEISSRNQLDIGVEFQPAEPPPGLATGPMRDTLFGGTNFGLGLGDLLSGAGFPSSGVSMGIRSLTNTEMNIGGKTYYIPNFDSFIRALREDTAFNILQSPKLLTLNNETATVDVSDEISIAESRYASYAAMEAETAIPAGVTETFRRTDVGISLEITPQINSENSVIMEVDLLVGSIAGVEDIAQAGTRPVIANRSTITKVRVDNGRTIVISGLRRADKTSSISRVPILGQIPILGFLFSHRKTLSMNTNLLVFITPHIVSDTLDMLEVTDTIKNQNLERERSRFMTVDKSGKSRSKKKKDTSEWDWKK